MKLNHDPWVISEQRHLLDRLMEKMHSGSKFKKSMTLWAVLKHFSHGDLIDLLYLVESCSDLDRWTVYDTRPWSKKGLPKKFSLHAFYLIQGLKNDMMRQFESQVHDFMDSLIEESASLESTPLPAAFSPPLSDKERSKLGYCCIFLVKATQIYAKVFTFNTIRVFPFLVILSAATFSLPTAEESTLLVGDPC